jgi:hypothetical protein
VGAARHPAAGRHTQREAYPWAINIPDHAQRTDSPAYRVARKVMSKLVRGLKHFYLGTGPYQDHHGGGLWVKDHDGWFLIKNLAGMEWSQQFCADPQKVDQLRLFAQRIYRRFPESLAAFKAMGFSDAEQVLIEPIDSAERTARWCDSIFNASVPLAAQRHTGVLQPKRGKRGCPALEGGVHHYPTPITDIQLFKRDDFQLWVADPQDQLAAVTPIGRRGSGDSRVRVAWATPGTKLHRSLLRAERSKKPLVLSGSHSLASQAFAAQTRIDARRARANARVARSSPVPRLPRRG